MVVTTQMSDMQNFQTDRKQIEISAEMHFTPDLTTLNTQIVENNFSYAQEN